MARQFLKLGLIDEISLHVVPVLFGSGTLIARKVKTRRRLSDKIMTRTAKCSSAQMLNITKP